MTKDAAMKPAISKPDARPHGPVHDAADGMASAVHQVRSVAGQTVDGVTTFRNTVRDAPLMMAFLLIGLGYVIGSVTTVRPRPAPAKPVRR
jgi:hypothetical protein